jgi:hypothetical protein
MHEPFLQVNGGQARVDLFDALRGVMYLQKRQTEPRTEFISKAAAELEALYTRFADQKVFVDYHRKQYGSDESSLAPLRTVINSFSLVK